MNDRVQQAVRKVAGVLGELQGAEILDVLSIALVLELKAAELLEEVDIAPTFESWVDVTKQRLLTMQVVAVTPLSDKTPMN